MNKRVTALSIRDKLKIINLCENGTKKKDVANKFKCNISTVNRTIKMAEEITRVSNSANLQRKRQRKGVHTKVEEALFNWFNQQRTKNALLSSDVLLNKAKEFAILLKDDFDPVQSWLWRWRQRYGIKFKRFHGEGKENDEVSAASFKNEFLPNILKNRKIDDIFNADESALLYKALPNATFMTNCEKPTGWKTQKSRLTLLFLCNATGTFKKIYTIGKFKNPR